MRTNTSRAFPCREGRVALEAARPPLSPGRDDDQLPGGAAEDAIRYLLAILGSGRSDLANFERQAAETRMLI